MAPRARLDAELVRRGLARSREHAGELIAAGAVTINGAPAVKPATNVGKDVPIVVKAQEQQWASRGAHKLIGALDAFEPAGLTVAGRRCLDAGASTGGFTDVLLDRGAASVAAVDVGYGQLIWRLRSDERVGVLDRTNVRSLTPEQIGGQVDLSFATLGSVLPHLKSGKLKALAVASRQRSALAPEVPTFQEAGVNGFVIDTRYGLLAPAGTPAEIVRKIQDSAQAFRDTPGAYNAALTNARSAAEVLEARDLVAGGSFLSSGGRNIPNLSKRAANGCRRNGPG